MKFKEFLLNSLNESFSVGLTYKVFNIPDLEGREATILKVLPSNGAQMFEVLLNGSTTPIPLCACNLQPVLSPAVDPDNLRLSDVTLLKGQGNQ